MQTAESHNAPLTGSIVLTAEQHTPPPQRTAVALTSPASLLQLAVEKGADMATLERLMDLQDRHEANLARKAYVEAMTAFKAEPIEIFKRKRVHFESKNGGATTDYKHAELSDVCDAIGPAMARHQLSYRWNVNQDGAKITVDCIVMHVLGHNEKVTMTAGGDASGNKNAIQQVASAVTYLQRYTLLAATGMSTKGEDNDGAGSGDGPAVVTADQAATLQAMLDECTAPARKGFLAFMKVAKVDEIPAGAYAVACDLIDAKRRDAAKVGAK